MTHRKMDGHFNKAEEASMPDINSNDCFKKNSSVTDGKLDVQVSNRGVINSPDPADLTVSALPQRHTEQFTHTTEAKSLTHHRSASPTPPPICTPPPVYRQCKDSEIKDMRSACQSEVPVERLEFQDATVSFGGSVPPYQSPPNVHNTAKSSDFKAKTQSVPLEKEPCRENSSSPELKLQIPPSLSAYKCSKDIETQEFISPKEHYEGNKLDLLCTPMMKTRSPGILNTPVSKSSPRFSLPPITNPTESSSWPSMTISGHSHVPKGEQDIAVLTPKSGSSDFSSMSLTPKSVGSPSPRMSPRVVVRFDDIRSGLGAASLAATMDEPGMKSPSEVTLKNISKTLILKPGISPSSTTIRKVSFSPSRNTRNTAMLPPETPPYRSAKKITFTIPHKAKSARGISFTNFGEVNNLPDSTVLSPAKTSGDRNKNGLDNCRERGGSPFVPIQSPSPDWKSLDTTEGQSGDQITVEDENSEEEDDVFESQPIEQTKVMMLDGPSGETGTRAEEVMNNMAFIKASTSVGKSTAGPSTEPPFNILTSQNSQRMLSNYSAFKFSSDSDDVDRVSHGAPVSATSGKFSSFTSGEPDRHAQIPMNTEDHCGFDRAERCSFLNDSFDDMNALAEQASAGNMQQPSSQKGGRLLSQSGPMESYLLNYQDENANKLEVGKYADISMDCQPSQCYHSYPNVMPTYASVAQKNYQNPQGHYEVASHYNYNEQQTENHVLNVNSNEESRTLTSPAPYTPMYSLLNPPKNYPKVTHITGDIATGLCNRPGSKASNQQQVEDFQTCLQQQQQNLQYAPEQEIPNNNLDQRNPYVDCQSDFGSGYQQEFVSTGKRTNVPLYSSALSSPNTDMFTSGLSFVGGNSHGYLPTSMPVPRKNDSQIIENDITHWRSMVQEAQGSSGRMPLPAADPGNTHGGWPLTNTNDFYVNHGSIKTGWWGRANSQFQPYERHKLGNAHWYPAHDVSIRPSHESYTYGLGPTLTARDLMKSSLVNSAAIMGATRRGPIHHSRSSSLSGGEFMYPSLPDIPQAIDSTVQGSQPWTGYAYQYSRAPLQPNFQTPASVQRYPSDPDYNMMKGLFFPPSVSNQMARSNSNKSLIGVPSASTLGSSGFSLGSYTAGPKFSGRLTPHVRNPKKEMIARDMMGLPFSHVTGEEPRESVKDNSGPISWNDHQQNQLLASPSRSEFDDIIEVGDTGTSLSPSGIEFGPSDSKLLGLASVAEAIYKDMSKEAGSDHNILSVQETDVSSSVIRPISISAPLQDSQQTLTNCSPGGYSPDKTSSFESQARSLPDSSNNAILSDELSHEGSNHTVTETSKMVRDQPKHPLEMRPYMSEPVEKPTLSTQCITSHPLYPKTILTSKPATTGNGHPVPSSVCTPVTTRDISASRDQSILKLLQSQYSTYTLQGYSVPVVYRMDGGNHSQDPSMVPATPVATSSGSSKVAVNGQDSLHFPNTKSAPAVSSLATGISVVSVTQGQTDPQNTVAVTKASVGCFMKDHPPVLNLSYLPEQTIPDSTSKVVPTLSESTAVLPATILPQRKIEPMKKKARLTKAPKPRHFKLNSITIGSFKKKVRNGGKLKIYFSRQFIVYEFELSDGPTLPVFTDKRCPGSFTHVIEYACIEIPFGSVVHLRTVEASVLFEMDSPPRVYVGYKPCTAKGLTMKRRPVSFNKAHVTDVTGGEIMRTPYHQLTLTENSEADTVLDCLIEYDLRFLQLLQAPFIWDKHKTFIPETKTKVLKSCKKPSVKGGCSCSTGCQVSMCSCVKAVQLCNLHCKCLRELGNCENPVQQLCNNNISLRLAKLDQCLVDNIGRVKDLTKYLDRVLMFPCCQILKKVRDCVPGWIACPGAPTCSKMYAYSWCTLQLHDKDLFPRTHCPECCVCGEINSKHCQACGKCFTPKDNQSRCPCSGAPSSCLPAGQTVQSSGHNGGQQGMTAGTQTCTANQGTKGVKMSAAKQGTKQEEASAAKQGTCTAKNGTKQQTARRSKQTKEPEPALVNQGSLCAVRIIPVQPLYRPNNLKDTRFSPEVTSSIDHVDQPAAPIAHYPSNVSADMNRDSHTSTLEARTCPVSVTRRFIMGNDGITPSSLKAETQSDHCAIPYDGVRKYIDNLVCNTAKAHNNTDMSLSATSTEISLPDTCNLSPADTTATIDTLSPSGESSLTTVSDVAESPAQDMDINNNTGARRDKNFSPTTLRPDGPFSSFVSGLISYEDETKKRPSNCRDSRSGVLTQEGDCQDAPTNGQKHAELDRDGHSDMADQASGTEQMDMSGPEHYSETSTKPVGDYSRSQWPVPGVKRTIMQTLQGYLSKRLCMESTEQSCEKKKSVDQDILNHYESGVEELSPSPCEKNCKELSNELPPVTENIPHFDRIQADDSSSDGNEFVEPSTGEKLIRESSRKMAGGQKSVPIPYLSLLMEHAPETNLDQVEEAMLTNITRPNAPHYALHKKTSSLGAMVIPKTVPGKEDGFIGTADVRNSVDPKRCVPQSSPLPFACGRRSSGYIVESLPISNVAQVSPKPTAHSNIYSVESLPISHSSTVLDHCTGQAHSDDYRVELEPTSHRSPPPDTPIEGDSPRSVKVTPLPISHSPSAPDHPAEGTHPRGYINPLCRPDPSVVISHVTSNMWDSLQLRHSPPAEDSATNRSNQTGYIVDLLPETVNPLNRDDTEQGHRKVPQSEGVQSNVSASSKAPYSLRSHTRTAMPRKDYSLYREILWENRNLRSYARKKKTKPSPQKFEKEKLWMMAHKRAAQDTSAAPHYKDDIALCTLDQCLLDGSLEMPVLGPATPLEAYTRVLSGVSEPCLDIIEGTVQRLGSPPYVPLPQGLSKLISASPVCLPKHM